MNASALEQIHIIGMKFSFVNSSPNKLSVSCEGQQYRCLRNLEQFCSLNDVMICNKQTGVETKISVRKANISRVIISYLLFQLLTQPFCRLNGAQQHPLSFSS